MAHRLQDTVRARYHFRCGYCGVTETDTGGLLTVDHYHPVAAGGSDDLNNRVYACHRCNLFKSDFSPTENELREGIRILHPILDDVTVHIVEDPITSLLMPITKTGRVHIQLLHLNRPALVTHRRRKGIELRRLRYRELLETNIRELRELTTVLTEYAAMLEREIDETR